MSWNYRVIRQEGEDPAFGIHEYFTALEHGPHWTENPVAVVGDSVDDLRWTLERMLEALDKPVIDTFKEAL